VLLAIAVLVVAFIVTWMTLPGSATGNPGHFTTKRVKWVPPSDDHEGYWNESHKYVPAHKRVSPPAAWFAGGLVHASSSPVGDNRDALDEYTGFTQGLKLVPSYVELGGLKQRIAILYGGAAVVVILVGLAFGLGRGRRPEPA